jgi:hypothetical protein
MSRRSPDAMSWIITPDTIFREERAHLALNGDVWLIERRKPGGTWELYDLDAEPLRLTCERDLEDGAKKWPVDNTLVELTGELPDPPHEWKVGDWFALVADEQPPARIVDINETTVAYQWRDADGDPAAAWSYTASFKNNAVPCDPHAWFTEDGAS